MRTRQTYQEDQQQDEGTHLSSALGKRGTYHRTLPRPTISRVQRIALVEAWHRTGTLAEADRHALITDMVPLVRHLAERYLGQGVPLEDLTQEGMLAVIEALDRFVSQKQLDFRRAARAAIFRAFQTCIERERAGAESCALEQLSRGESRWGRNTLGLPLFWSPVSDETRDPVAALVLAEERMQGIRIGLRLLSPRQRRVLLLRYGLVTGQPLNLETIAAREKLTRERIRQIEVWALRQLRHSARLSDQGKLAIPHQPPVVPYQSAVVPVHKAERARLQKRRHLPAGYAPAHVLEGQRRTVIPLVAQGTSSVIGERQALLPSRASKRELAGAALTILACLLGLFLIWSSFFATLRL